MNTILKVSDIVSYGRPASSLMEASTIQPTSPFRTPAPPSVGDGLRYSPRIDEGSVDRLGLESDESETEEDRGGVEDGTAGRRQVSNLD